MATVSLEHYIRYK